MQLKSDRKVTTVINQLPNDVILAVPITGTLVDDRGVQVAEVPKIINDEFCQHPPNIQAMKPFEILDPQNVIEVLWPTGCKKASGPYGGDVYVTEYLPGPYFKHVVPNGK